MKVCGRGLRKRAIIFWMSFCLFSISSFASNIEKEKSIQQLLEDQKPLVSFSFSKDIINFFNTDLDWNDHKKHLEGDFTKAGFFAFNKNTSDKTIEKLFKKQDYIMIKIDDEISKEEEVLMYVKKKGKEVEEAHFLIQSTEKLVIFSLYGKMRLKEKK